jgi:YVTN family beta-propeller protein
LNFALLLRYDKKVSKVRKEAFMKKWFGIFLVLAMGLSGCEMKSVMLKPALPLEEEGEVFVYMQPFPQQAERLQFSCDGFSAVKNDGTEYPLPPGVTDLGGGATTRQRLFASGQLPPGSYTGFSIKITKATLKQEEGDAALLVPDTPVRMDFPFTVERKRAVVVAMSFRYAESVKGGYGFSPSFSIFIPGRPLLSVTGYVTNRSSHNITVFDKRSGLVSAVIETGMSPAGVVFDQNARRAYVALSGEDAVEVIDVTAGEVINRIGLHTGDRPVDLVLTPDGKTLLAANTGSNTVSFIDPFNLAETGRVSVGNDTASLLLD